MNPVFTILSALYIFAIFFFADSSAVSQIGEFNPYSLLHIPLYGLLTFLLLLSFCTGEGRHTSGRVIAAALLAGIVGAVDEFHQSFIPTREGSARDVLLDVLGVILALWLFRLSFLFLKSKFRSLGKNA